MYVVQSVLPPNILPMIVILQISTVLPVYLLIHAHPLGASFLNLLLSLLPRYKPVACRKLMHLPFMPNFTPNLTRSLQPQLSLYHHRSMQSCPRNYLPQLPTPPCRIGLNQHATLYILHLPFTLSHLPLLISFSPLSLILSL